MSSQDSRAYILVQIQPGKEKEFADEVLSKRLIFNSKGERMDFFHGSFDYVIIFHRPMKDIDAAVMELRSFSFVRKTETLVCFDLFTSEDISGQLEE